MESVMLVLIDESGDPGFELKRGSSPYFVVCMVVFKNFDQAEACSSAIQQLQKDKSVYPEFKFSNCRAEIRDHFFACVRKFDFSIYALVVPKRDIYSPTLRSDTGKFYNYFVRQLLTQNQALLAGADIKIDESGDRRFKQELIAYLRRVMDKDCIKSVKFKPSRGDHLIQLADMVTGAISRLYTEKKDNARWHNMLVPKIANLWEFS
jgi:hypothetical protein